MRKILIMSWRNIWRNKLRSSVIIIAVAIGLFAGVFTTAFMKGMMDQRLKNAIKTEISHIQVHHQDFLETSDFNDDIDSSSLLVKEFEKIDGVKAASGRIIVQGMAAIGGANAGVKLVGINPGNEKMVTNIHDNIVEGHYFKNYKKKDPIVIGKQLAEELDIGVGSKVILTFQDSSGNITRNVFKVNGIFKTVNDMFERTNAFVKMDDLAKLTGINPNASHEIAIYLEEDQYAGMIKDKIISKVPSLDVKTWKEISPELAMIDQSMGVTMYIVIIIILIALGFGIVNTMLMVVLERIKEFGMLMAIGMNGNKIFIMILVETVLLVLTGGIVGILMGTGVSKIFEYQGIDLSLWAKGLTAYGYDPIVYTQLDMEMVGVITLLVIITGILASLYPAIKAVKLKPVEALRTE
ncbi:MAG: ABC transporter permease [Bacteroidota bacterium]